MKAGSEGVPVTVHPERPIVDQKDASKAEHGLVFEPLDAVRDLLAEGPAPAALSPP